MNDEIPDSTVILVIATTVILVFTIIFLFKGTNTSPQPSLEWKTNTNPVNTLEI